MLWALARMGAVGAAERNRAAQRCLRMLDAGEVTHMVKHQKPPQPSEPASSPSKSSLAFQPTKRRYATSALVFKEKIGLLANEFFSSFERASGRVDGWIQAFCVKQFGTASDAAVPRATKAFVRRCRDMVRSSKYLAGRLTKGQRHKGGTMRTKWLKRRRSHGFQGRPLLMPELRHLLFQWFVDIRSSVKSSLKNRDALAAAR